MSHLVPALCSWSKKNFDKANGLRDWRACGTVETVIDAMGARRVTCNTERAPFFSSSLQQTQDNLSGQRSQMHVLQKLIRFARKSPRQQLQTVEYRLIEMGWRVPHLGNDRTVYIVGLYGAGRHYLNELMLQHIGGRAKYFRAVNEFRFHSGPTSMIYSGHSTMRHDCWGHQSPAVTSRILEAVSSRFADLIFIYRHPLDSLLTNWIYLRTFGREKRTISGISELYKNTDDLCAALEHNFSEFKAFAEGAPDFSAVLPGGQRFISFPEFVEETELFLQSATLTLRLEDFMIDPLKEFSKVVEVMSAELDLRHLGITLPRAKPYGYLTVVEKAPLFRNFVNGLDTATKARIEKIGYSLGG